MTRRALNHLQRAMNRAITRGISNIAIPIMELGAVSDFAEQKLLEGVSLEALPGLVRDHCRAKGYQGA